MIDGFREISPAAIRGAQDVARAIEDDVVVDIKSDVEYLGAVQATMQMRRMFASEIEGKS